MEWPSEGGVVKEKCDCNGTAYIIFKENVIVTELHILFSKEDEDVIDWHKI